MNKLLSLILLAVMALPTYAQTSGQKCLTNELTQRRAAADPQYARELQLAHDAMVQYAQQQHGSPRATRTISVVVHVLYNTGTPAQNIPTSYITNMISNMNKDFSLTNADTSAVRAAFKSVRGNAQIQFCLDTIIRKQTSKTCFDENTESDYMKFNAQGGSNAVNPSQFLNIWIVALCGSSINGGVGGYTVFPTAGVAGSSYDGVVIDYRLGFRNLILGASDPDRVATHEVGHYFGLEHTWGGGNIGATCGDDGFSDTPITKGANSVCTASTACTASPGSQYENFMDYSSCPHMFTIQQAAEMNRVFTQTRGSLLNSTGCSNVPSAPTADFTADKVSVCPGSTVQFTDGSANSPTSWSWTFAGGTPATSTAQNPSVVYNTPGTYTVTLVATNGNGSNTATKTAYITVLTAATLPLTEGFQSTTFPPTNWQLLNPDAGYTFTRVTSAGGYGTSTASMKMDCYNNDVIGDQDLILSPPYNFSSVTSAKLKYDYAYALYSTTYSDTLSVIVTTDCGTTYYLLKVRGGSGLATAPNNTTAFTPTAAQWKSDTIDLSALAGYPSIQIGFLVDNGNGNNIYLDNINMYLPPPTAPVADFVGSPTTVVVGGTVNFTDQSTNGPTTWSWSFPGAVTSTSTVRNPASIQYNTVGTYNVTLTSGNTAGSNTKTKTAYINVISSLPAGCDTLSNILATDTLTIYGAGANANSGYLSGHNEYGDLAKADAFTPSVSGMQIKGSYFYFGVAKFANANSKIKVKVWNANGTGGSPGTVLDSTNLSINAITTTGLTYVAFPNTPTITGNFFVGIELTYGTAGDSIALVTNKVNTIHNYVTGWEKSSAGVWGNYVAGWGAGANISNVILPVLCSPTVVVPAPVAAFTGAPTTVCVGSSVTYTDQSTNTPTSWSWTFPGGTPATSTLQNPTVVYNTAGTYNATLIATNTGGSNTLAKTNYITVKTPPTAIVTGTNVSCPGGTNGATTLTVTGGTTPYTFRWSNNATTQNLSSLVAATYTVTVTDNAGCTATGSYTVTQPLVITMSVVGTNATCGQANGTASANATGGTPPFTYSWSNSQTGGTITNLAANTYSVTATDANGCTKIGSVTITSSGALTLTLAPTATTCGRSNGAITATAAGGSTPYSYAWSNGQSTATATALASGTYTITVRDNGGCSATSSSTVATSTAISATATATQATCAQSNGSATVVATGGSGYTYSWNNGQTNATATGLAAGNYSVTVTATGGCTATATASVSNTGGPTVSVSNTTNVLCFGGTTGALNLSVSGGNGSYAYNWSNGRNTQNINSLAAGTYNVTVTSNGCVSTASGVVTQPAQLIANATSQAVACYGGTSGSATVQVSGGTPNYSYLWNNGQQNATATILAAGSFTVTISDQNSCTATTGVTVSQPTQLSATVNASNPGCTVNNGSASITVFGGTPGYTYSWSGGAGNNSTASNLGVGAYTVTATDSRGCTITQSVTLVTQSGPSISLSSTPVGCSGTNNGTATVTVLGGATPYTYNWSNSQTTANITALSAGTYTVTVRDAAGCTANGSVTVTSTGFSVSDVTTNIATCQGANTGSIVLTVTGGSGNYTYNWSGSSSTSASLFTLAAGTYNVTVTDNQGGCQSTRSYTITEPTSLTDTVIATPTIQGGATGTASVSIVSGGTPPYSYSWSNGQTTANLTALAAGTYSVTVKDANNCTSVSNVVVSSTVGVATVGNDFKFDVYPNPNDGRFQVNLAFGEQTNCSVQVYNSVGSLIYSVEKTKLLEDNFSIDLSNYASATYSVRLVSNDHNLVKKVTVFK